MPKIVWNDSFSVYNAEIDEQHKKWIEIFNKMHETLMDGGAEARQVIGGEVLKEMQDYARYHFDFEEEYMRTINYPELHEHSRAHKDFDNQIYKYNRENEQGNVILNTEIIKLIENWLLDHIGVEDQKYVLFLRRENKI